VTPWKVAIFGKENTTLGTKHWGLGTSDEEARIFNKKTPSRQTMRHRILDNSILVVPSAYCLVPSANDSLQLTTED
jgi:hypothetical protein